jgi:hypothetical protein
MKQDVFTQPGSFSDMAASLRHFRASPQSRHPLTRLARQLRAFSDIQPAFQQTVKCATERCVEMEYSLFYGSQPANGGQMIVDCHRPPD